MQHLLGLTCTHQLHKQMLFWREPESYLTPQHCKLPQQVRKVPSSREKMHRNHRNKFCLGEVGQNFKAILKLCNTLWSQEHDWTAEQYSIVCEGGAESKQQRLEKYALKSHYPAIAVLCPVFVCSHIFFLMTSLGFIWIHIIKPFDSLVLLRLPFTRMVKGRTCHKTHSKAIHLWGLPYSTQPVSPKSS